MLVTKVFKGLSLFCAHARHAAAGDRTSKEFHLDFVC